MPTRQEVYEAIDSERDYQDSKPPRPKSDAETTVAEWLNYIRYTLGKAENAVYFLKEVEALEYVRKIAALAVACMENRGAPPRSG